MKRVILRNRQSPGDLLMLTAAVRDLHRGYPRRFVTSVQTACPAVRSNNPFVAALCGCEADVERIECAYPLIQQSCGSGVGFYSECTERGALPGAAAKESRKKYGHCREKFSARCRL